MRRERNGLESPAIEGDSPLREAPRDMARLNTPVRPIVYQYREGKVKSTPSRRVK